MFVSHLQQNWPFRRRSS